MIRLQETENPYEYDEDRSAYHLVYLKSKKANMLLKYEARK